MTTLDRTTFHRLSNVDHAAKSAVCSRCGPVRIRVRTRDGRLCATCWTVRKAEWKRDPNTRRRQLLQRFGLTFAEYDALLAEQSGGCGICGQPEDETQKQLAVDHDHQTGAVRGLLCGKCNRALGLLGDTAESVSRALEYLTGTR